MIRSKLDLNLGERMREKIEKTEIQIDQIEVKIDKVEDEIKNFQKAPIIEPLKPVTVEHDAPVT